MEGGYTDYFVLFQVSLFHVAFFHPIMYKIIQEMIILTAS